MDVMINLQFITFEVNSGKEGVFVESIVRNYHLAGLQNPWNKFILLVITTHQKKYLGLKSVTTAIAVEIA